MRASLVVDFGVHLNVINMDGCCGNLMPFRMLFVDLYALLSTKYLDFSGFFM